ncbi:serine O-acetyltransferase EpsC [Flavobacteriaceae bacterium M23B6Z8]
MTKPEIIDDIIGQKRVPNVKLKLKQKTEFFTDLLYSTLFDVDTDVALNLETLEDCFKQLAEMADWTPENDLEYEWNSYLKKLPSILELLMLDAKAHNENDPASNSLQEVYLSYPGFFAIAIHRLSHELYKVNFPLIPRLMAEYAHRLTGVDLNPGAQIGKSFFIDHATGVVIGETAVIKNNVKIYQGVTLGALSVSKKLQNVKRHPTVEDNVTIYANATILGGETIIGANSVIGGNVWLTTSVPEYSVVSHTPDIKIKTARTNE